MMCAPAASAAAAIAGRAVPERCRQRRGLVFVDDGTSIRQEVEETARRCRVRTIRAPLACARRMMARSRGRHLLLQHQHGLAR
jgi:hypothetical protein